MSLIILSAFTSFAINNLLKSELRLLLDIDFSAICNPWVLLDPMHQPYNQDCLAKVTPRTGSLMVQKPERRLHCFFLALSSSFPL